MRMLSLASLCLLLLAGCGETQPPASRPVVASRALVPDSSRFQHVKYDFYCDKAGRLFEQKWYLTGREADAKLHPRYDSTLLVNKASDRTELPLASIIDLATYQNVGNSMFSKDKNRVYYFYSTSGGGFRVIVNGANPATFRASPDYQYGFDDKHGFYCDQQLRGLRLNRQQLLYDDTVAHFIAYVKDDRHVFYQGSFVPGADARTFRLVRGRAWEAEDKNHRYQCCGQRLN
jgi:hypothetical protein